ncbi:MAG: amidohydrolase, partial [Ignavibacteriales bacterium]
MKYLLFLLFVPLIFAQVDSVLQVEEYAPKSTLVVPENILTKSKFPFIDVHSHQRDMSEE